MKPDKIEKEKLTAQELLEKREKVSKEIKGLTHEELQKYVEERKNEQENTEKK